MAQVRGKAGVEAWDPCVLNLVDIEQEMNLSILALDTNHKRWKRENDVSIKWIHTVTNSGYYNQTKEDAKF